MWQNYTHQPHFHILCLLCFYVAKLHPPATFPHPMFSMSLCGQITPTSHISTFYVFYVSMWPNYTHEPHFHLLCFLCFHVAKTIPISHNATCSSCDRHGKSIYLFFSFDAALQAVTFEQKRMGPFTEYVGYAASALVLISFLMKDIRVLRIVNSVGCVLFIIYGGLLVSIPIIITNVSIVLINLYYLLRSRKPVV
jgi:hypothetical protein